MKFMFLFQIEYIFEVFICLSAKPLSTINSRGSKASNRLVARWRWRYDGHLGLETQHRTHVVSTRWATT